MFSFLWTLGSFVLALGILVAVHEWGHFWVARRCGVKVLRFSIGFGKPLWRTHDSKGTEYVVAAIPLGGYVRMLDSRMDEVKPEEQSVTFNSQPVYKRMAIIVAGPLVNFIFAVFAYYIMFLIGTQASKPIIGNIIPDSIAAQAQLPADMQISKVGDREVRAWSDINLEFVSYIGDDKMQITLYEPRSLSEKQYTLDISEWQFDPDTQSAIRSLGIEVFRPKVTTIIDAMEKNSPAELAGLQINDKLISIDGTPLQKWEQIGEQLVGKANQSANIVVERDGVEVTTVVSLGAHERDPTLGYIGITPFAEPWPEEYIFNHQYGPVAALGVAMDNTWRLMTLSVEMIGKLFTGDVSFKNLSGPISIAQGAGASAGYGLVPFLSFLALISVNLGIVNLLPLPVLDGGHLLYFTIEWLTGKPVPESVQEIGLMIGGALLFCLMALALFNDFGRL